MTRFLSWPRHWRNGRTYGIPVCCTVRWILQHRPGFHYRPQAVERGLLVSRTGTPFVPCGVFHRDAWPMPVDEEWVDSGVGSWR